MGFRICYIGSRLHPDEMLSALGLQIIGTEDEMPAGGWWIATLNISGWSILWSEDEEFGASSQDRITELSHKAELLHCEVNETVMWSSAEYWSKGSAVWKVTHAGDGDDIFNLTAEGELPHQFNGIKEQHIQAQERENDCDHIFEVPLELAKSILAFRHEDVLEHCDVDEFRIVAAPQKSGFFSKILGRGR